MCLRQTGADGRELTDVSGASRTVRAECAKGKGVSGIVSGCVLAEECTVWVSVPAAVEWLSQQKTVSVHRGEAQAGDMVMVLSPGTGTGRIVEWRTQRQQQRQP